MTAQCDTFRERIAQALVEELPAAEAEALRVHVAQCAACAEEERLYVTTLSALRPSDEEVPRHFFVYPQERSSTFRDVFALLSIGRKAALAACAAAVVLAVVVAGRAPRTASPDTARLPAQVDTAALRAELLRIVDARLAADRRETVAVVRAELEQFRSASGARDRAAFERALASLETRMNERLVGAASEMQTTTGRALTAMYQNLEEGRRRDLGVLDDRVSRVAAQGEIKGNQTDAILQTLLEFAELRLDRLQD
jgi:hypothetical protein